MGENLTFISETDLPRNDIVVKAINYIILPCRPEMRTIYIRN